MTTKGSTAAEYTDTKLDVPYVSQYRDVADPEQRPRACGMASVYMVLRYFGANVPPLDALITRGMNEGGYSQSGWIHDYFVSVFREFGFACERQENMQERDTLLIRDSIKEGNPVIVSAARRLWDQRMFHMVVITGIREDASGSLEGFFYHDPASLSEPGLQHLYVAVPTFMEDWRKMAIFPKRLAA